MVSFKYKAQKRISKARAKHTHFLTRMISMFSRVADAAVLPRTFSAGKTRCSTASWFELFCKFIFWINSNNNKPSHRVSRLPTVFLAKKFSKYRLKQPKHIVLGTPKKPDKIPKNGQNRFRVIKQCFLGKIRGKNFLPVPNFQNMYSFLPKYKWNMLKIDFKNTYFQVFPGFPAIPASYQNPASSQMTNFGQFLAKMGETGFFKKKRLEHFFRLYKP